MNGIDWLGDIPTHWEVTPLRFLTSVSGGATPDTQNVDYWSGPIPWVSPKDMKRDFVDDAEDHVSEAALSNSALKMIEPGAILIVVRGMILAHSFPTAINTVPVTINQDMKALSCSARIEPTFLVSVLKAARDHIVTLADSSAHGTKKLETELLGRLEIPVPPIVEQHRIAYLVDRETADIDALIAAKQRLLDLLAEKRRAIVAEGVMRGLNPAAPMRPSGIDWLGDIPAHWEAIPLRFLVSFSGGATPDTRNFDYWSGAIPWVSPKDMKRDFLNDAEDHVSEAALDNSALKMIEPNAILIVVRGMILAHSFPTAINKVPVTINQDMKALRCVERIAPAFLVDVLKGAKDYLVSLADSSAHGTKKLETEALGRFEVPVPPLAEQHEIVRHIAAETAKIDRLRAATEHSITLLMERRGALIAAAVTGQIDIPEAA